VVAKAIQKIALLQKVTKKKIKSSMLVVLTAQDQKTHLPCVFSN